MGKNLNLLKAALDSRDWLTGDPLLVESLLAILQKVANGEGVVLGGESPPRAGKILIATGGTTGHPRFAIHTWDTLCAAANCLARKLGKGIDSYSILPLGHVSGFMPAARAIVSGGKLVLGSKNTLPEDSKGLCISLVPTQLMRFLDDPEAVKKLGGFRMVFLGGAAADPDLLSAARESGIPVAPCYGMTETGAMVTMLDPGDFLDGEGGCGGALPGVDITIGGDGQVFVDTPGLSEGYAGGDGELQQPFATKDRGEFGPSGSLKIIGRMDRVIITGGEKVDPGEVESSLRSIPGVQQCLVVGMEDLEWGQKLTAFVTGHNLLGQHLEKELRKVLPSHKIPKEILVVEKLPFDEKGKLDWEKVRALIRARGHAPVRARAESDPPGGG